jgi:hypothetical protein
LEPPRQRGTITVADVMDAQYPAEHSECVWRWAKSVWQAWESHHAWAREAAQRYR